MESGLKNENLLLKIEKSGSFTLPLRNSAGVNFFDDRDFEDGVISRPLRRDGYDLELLRQSIDISITELADVTDVELPDTVLREVYNDALAQIEEITETVQSLERENSELETTVSNLEAEISNLKSLNDNLEILKATSDNQLEVINDRLITVIEDLQSAIQKSIAEAIQRASLQARNELLISENNSLKEQLFGRQAQIEAGAKSSGTLFTVRALDVSSVSETPIFATQKFTVTSRILGRNFKENKDIRVVNGRRLEVFNSSGQPLTITVRNVNAGWIRNISSIALEPNQKRTITISTNKDWSESKYSKVFSGSLLFETISDTGVTEQVSIGANLSRNRE